MLRLSLRVGLAVLLALAAISVAVPLSATASPPQPVTIVMNGVLAGPDLVTGSWTASGAVSDAGSYVETFRFAGTTIHSVKTLTSTQGTITMAAQGVIEPTSPTTIEFRAGHWRIVSGTGAYQGLKGGGSPVTDPGGADLATGAVSVTHRGTAHYH